MAYSITIKITMQDKVRIERVSHEEARLLEVRAGDLEKRAEFIYPPTPAYRFVVARAVRRVRLQSAVLRRRRA